MIYLLGVLATFVLWGALFFWKKELRKEMLIMSGIVAVYGMIIGYFVYTQDWWLPPTITGTRVGIEDFLLGFSCGGIMTALPATLVPRQQNAQPRKRELLIILAAALVSAFVLWQFLPSWLAGPIPAIIGASVMFIYRNDLIKSSVLSACMFTLLTLPLYLVLIALDPTLPSWYFWKHLTGITILRIPIEEFLFWFSSALFIAPLYPFWHGRRQLSRT